jgi:pimeloyl-ACP methyl ester carboxylesterase
MKNNCICWYIAVLYALILHTDNARAESEKGKTQHSEEEVQFSSGDISLAATLSLPHQDTKVPAVVIIHGSGKSDRNNPWTRAYAQALAVRGLAVLHPDKRGSGMSQGDWKTAGILDFADDAVAAVEYLRKNRRIDPARVGLIGFSQGGHVLPAAVARNPHVAFVIDVSGSVLTMSEQMADEIEIGAERAGLQAAQIKLLLDLHRKGLRYVQSGTDEHWSEYASALQQAKQGELKGNALLESFPNRRDDPIRDQIRAILPYDPMPYWKKVSIPVLFVFGGNDARLRVRKSIDRIQNELPNNQYNYALLFFSKNGHALYREDLNDFIARWIADNGVP